MVKKIISIAFLIFGFVATAQIPLNKVSFDQKTFPDEKVQLSINSNILLAGELLQYKAYSLNSENKPSVLSKILYVSLRSEKDSIVFSHKLTVENGTANGDFFIPSSLKTGIYRLIGYTNFSRNRVSQAYARQYIHIVNPFLKTSKSLEKTSDTTNFSIKFENIAASNFSSKSDHFSITTDKSTYGPREKVDLKIEKIDENISGNFVLSVRKINPLKISEFTSDSHSTQSSEAFYLPEIRGEIISGRILSAADNIPVSGKEVSLTIPGKNYVFKLAKTNDNGRFFFSVAEGYSAEKSIIQVNGSPENIEKFKIALDDKSFKIGKSTLPNIKLDPLLKDWLENRSIQMQIENAYFDIKKDSIFREKSNTAFFANLGTVFLLDDYTRFPTVRETFVEVVTLAAIRGTGDNARFIVNNEYDPKGIAKFNDLDPLVLMDGMQILNNTDLINYNAREIESIRAINTPYRYGPKIFSGIIAVETKKGNFVPSLGQNSVLEMDFPPVVKRKQYYAPDYKKASNLSRIPDYRAQLLWSPKLKMEGKDTYLSFFTSDVGGLYEIIIEGFAIEGEYISDKDYFTVSGN